MRVSDFERFMEEVHGHRPFPWQTSLVKDTVDHGTWPSTVDVPTGLGKTSMLDVAVFLLAMSAGEDAQAHLGRRRMYMVVDRRIVVDQAEEHAKTIARALDEAGPGSMCREIASRLKSLWGGQEKEPALRVVKMRGGVTWDASWLPRPDLPAIVTGTVDQVGSRLFFRGYGVSPRRRPIDAALVGTDSVIMLDEAHLSRAFTAAVVSAHNLETCEVLGLPGTAVVQLSATCPDGLDSPNEWDATFDEAAHFDNPSAMQRLTAAKTLTFAKSSKDRVVEDIARRAVELSSRQGSRVLVVCNTVNRARDVHAALAEDKRRLPNVELHLLIGRSRGIDRERTANRILCLFGADREQTPDSAVLVATQTVEVGIDLDATDMVTETASWDSLVQRFGRVNRRGSRAESSISVIEDCDKKPSVYREAKVNTAAFLETVAASENGLDVSPLELRRQEIPENLVTPSALLPVLLPAHLDAWARTSPAPSNDPPVEPYLHGIDKTAAPIMVTWRTGLFDGLNELLPADEAGAVVSSLPIRNEEAVEVPLGAVRAWLENKRDVSLSDLEGADDIPFGDNREARLVLRRYDDATWQWIPSEALRPGDSVVAPREYGGLDVFGWKPQSEECVTDVAELAALRRGQAVLRLDAGVAARLGLPPQSGIDELVAEWRASDEPDHRDEVGRSLIEAVKTWLADTAQQDSTSPWTTDDLAQLRNGYDGGAMITQNDDRVAPVLTSTLRANGWRGIDEDAEAETSSLSERVTLAKHLSAVGERAAEIAAHLGLSPGLKQVVIDAARWHDWGKVDSRFQAMLFGGSSIEAELADEPLAKSGMPATDRTQLRRAARLSGFPKGARHEAWSEMLVSEYLSCLPEPYPGDADLVRHLVASHHGHARPLLPPSKDPGGQILEATFDGRSVTTTSVAGVRLSDADRFAKLNRRYGRWGLALLEAIVRCADMTVSSEGS